MIFTPNNVFLVLIFSMMRLVVGKESMPYRQTDHTFEESTPASQSTPLNADSPQSTYGAEY